MAVTAHPIASKLAANVLTSGGNAAAAGITALSALSVVEPHASGMGGGGYALYYDAKTKQVSLIDYRETAPAGVVPETYYQPADTYRIKLQGGGTAILTPGAWLGWETLAKNHANRQISELLPSVAALADSGYVPSEKQKTMILEHVDGLSQDDRFASYFFTRDEELNPVVNRRIRFEALSKTYSSIAKANSFTILRTEPYRDQIVTAVRNAGGALAATDLENFRVTERKPVKITYRGYEIYTIPMPSAGGTSVALALKMLEGVDLRAMGWQSADAIHLIAEAIRQGMTDGYAWGGDPQFVSSYTDSILGPTYASKALQKIPRDSVRDRATPYDTTTAHGNTTHLVIADRDGDLLSITQSINYFFGSNVIDHNTGILFNNHAADYDWRPGRRNSIAPGRRPSSWMSPVIILKDGKPWLVAGTPGGPRIPAVMVELLVALIDFDKPLNEAMDAARYFPNGKFLEFEPRLPDPTVKALQKKGWKMKERGVADSYFGGAQAIQFLPDGRKVGVGDTRRDGAPAAE